MTLSLQALTSDKPDSGQDFPPGSEYCFTFRVRRLKPPWHVLSQAVQVVQANSSQSFGDENGFCISLTDPLQATQSAIDGSLAPTLR